MKVQHLTILGMLTMLAVSGFSLAHAADDRTYLTFPIRIEKNPVASSTSPSTISPITKDHVAFNIINNTGEALYFTGSEKEYVPVVSHTTVIAGYSPGQQYQVVDADGKAVASWTLGDKVISASGASSASADQFKAWEETLQSVIANQKVSYVEAPRKPEPSYEAHSQSSARSTQGEIIRGYW
jgi:hypothetical protein